MKQKTKKARRTTKRKQVVNSKKVRIDGITFASGLEGVMYKLLKEAGIKFGYESHTYNIIEPFELEEACWERATRRSKSMVDRRKVTKMSYTPDFVADDQSWIIECKGRANQSFPLRWKIFKIFISKWDNKPVVFKPTNKQDCIQVVEILKQKGYATK